MSSYRGTRRWSDDELDDGLWLSFARETTSGLEEVTSRTFVVFEDLRSRIPRTRRVRFQPPVVADCIAVAKQQDGPVVEQLYNGALDERTRELDVVVSWHRP